MTLPKLRMLSISNLINYLILVYAFSIPFDKGITKAIGVLLIVLWLLEWNMKSKIIILAKSNVMRIFALFILYNYISIFWSNHTLYAYHYVSKYIYYLPVLVVVFTSIEKKYIPYSMVSFFAGIFISEVITYGIYFGLWTTEYNELMAFSSPTAFMSRTLYSAILALAGVLSFYKILSTSSIGNRLFYAMLYFSIAINLFISGGRTGLPAFIIGHLILIIYLFGFRIKYIVLAALGLTILLFSSYTSIDIFKQRIDVGYKDIIKMTQDGNYRSSIGNRVAMLNVGAMIVRDNPLFGVGIKDNMDEMLRYSEQIDGMKHIKRYYKWHFHNQYMDILTQNGLVGFLLFIAIFYYIMKIKIKNKDLDAVKVIFVVVVMSSMISSDIFHQKHYIFLLSLFIGLLLAQNRYENEDKY